jgi:hypothetical protein
MFGNHLAAESGLNEFELIQGQPRQATVVGVHNLVAFAEGRAQDANGISPMGLDLEMDGAEGFQDGYVISTRIYLSQA